MLYWLTYLLEFIYLLWLSSVMLGCIICSFSGYFNRGNVRSRAFAPKMSVDDIQEMSRDISLFDR
jgi:hypothetical protein